MLKHYIKYRIRHWWPLLLIFGLTLTLIYAFTGLNVSLTYRFVHTPYGSHRSGDHFFSGNIIFFVCALIVAMVMPLFVYRYRTSKQSADVFYQAAYSPTTVKRVHFLIGLGIVLASVTAAFLLGYLIVVIRYSSTEEARYLSSGTEIIRFDLNLSYYLLFFLVCIVSVAATYSISSFIVSLGNYVFDQIMLLIFGNIFLALCFFTPLNYILMFHNEVSTLAFSFSLWGFGPIGPGVLSTYIDEMIAKRTVTENQTILAANSILAMGLQVLLASACAVFNLKLPDPSGEHADVSGARNKAVALIPHGAAFVLGIGLAISCRGFINAQFSILPFFLFALFGVVYYALLALWRHSFKINKFDLIFYLSVLGTVLIAVVCSGIQTPSNVNY